MTNYVDARELVKAALEAAMKRFHPYDVAVEKIGTLAADDVAVDAIIASVTPAEPVAWVEVADTNEGPYKFHGQKLMPRGEHSLYAAPVLSTYDGVEKLLTRIAELEAALNVLNTEGDWQGVDWAVPAASWRKARAALREGK